jgi:hypothetical protein
MARGGARVNSGPPPDPNALRRDRKSDQAGWTTLPAEGRKGRTPKWPLPPDVRLSAALDVAEREREVLEAQAESEDAPRGALAKLARMDQRIAELRNRLEAAADMEAHLWRDLWRTPQAVAWERLRWTREVGLYVRWQVHAELGDLEAAKEARQWSDRLGLNPTAMLRNRWRIEDQPAPAARRPSGGRPSAKQRMLKVVEGGG